MVGLGEAWSETFDTPAAADAWWADLARRLDPSGLVAGAPSAMGPLAFCSFPFDPGNTRSRCVLTVPHTVIGLRGGTAWVTAWGEPPADLGRPAETAPSPGSVAYDRGSFDHDCWIGAVEAALERIGAGELDKVVLARQETARAERPIRPGFLLDRLQAAYRDTWTFAVGGLIGATPELLVRRDQGLVTSRVLAGTIRRHGPTDADDLALALASSSKDLAEHEFAVASVAGALAPHCSGMNVPETPSVLRLPNVMHLATDITGVARSDASAVALAAAVHPSAAVCGTPTDRARDLIRRLEGADRGRYAGPVGWIGRDGDGDLGIALRCGQLETPDTMTLFAGCGIVACSEPESEWAETAAKLAPMKQALGGPR
ncbi:MAG: chorismate-binding protein [Propionibacteriaceae bacterium]|jgi:menaquinone-specific isochorismate synthase|nr:chorismate-binding protein [Propionibacteriaceae bacterium]